MREESPQSFPRQNDAELLDAYIKSKLKEAGIALQRINIDILNNTCTVNTDNKVPREIILSIREYVENKGFTIRFLPSG